MKTRKPRYVYAWWEHVLFSTPFVLFVVVAVAIIVASCGGGSLVVDGGFHTETNTVGVKVGTPCYTDDIIPQKPAVAKVDDKAATTDQLSAASAANAEQFSAYADAADKLLRQCVKSTQPGGSNVVTKPAK